LKRIRHKSANVLLHQPSKITDDRIVASLRGTQSNGGDRGRHKDRVFPLLLGPIDDFEKHSALEHLGFKVGCVLFPIRCLAHEERGLDICCLRASSAAKAPRTASYIMVRLSSVKAL
jgi:hypothetical protein